ncbi:MAG: S8 family serine peptidase [Flavobacteriales bacterium]|nr:S8 family serine peptidase [Flavobacteriales bacterium]
MKRIVPLLTALLFSVSLFTTLRAQTINHEYYDGQLWVQVQPTTTKGLSLTDDKVNLEAFRQIIGSELAETYGLSRVRRPFHFAIDPGVREVYQLFFDAAGLEMVFARALEKLDVVNYAERVPIMRPSLTPNDLGAASGNPNQWGLHRINAQQAWDITTGNTTVKVAVVDDAVLTTHPDLIPNLLPGRDVADNDNDPMPNETGMSHGTHVAGIVSAATNNGVGVASIGFSVKILPVKSSNSSEFISDAYAGVVWAYQNGADVINMSWGGSGYSQTGQDIMNNAASAGCVNVAAAGNDGVNTVFYPAGYSNVISVASTTTNDAKSSFSNYGSWIDISAPGSSIRSTYFNSSYSPTYANLDGTSMASPMVAGLCGLVKSVNPQMTRTQIENCVLSTADNINAVNSSYIGQLGAGRINAYQAVLCAQTTINAPPIAVIQTDNPLRCPGANVQFYGSSIGGLPNSYQWSFPGGSPTTSTSQNPVVNYASIGTYTVSLTLTNAFGTDTETLNGYVNISPSGTDIFFTESFETGTFTSNGWSVQNPDNGITWGLFTVAGSISGTKAAGINLFNYDTQGQRDGLTTAVLDFSNHANIQLDFQHAHRRYSADYRDSLIVYVSTNGGTTFPFRVLAAAENGTGSFATNSILGSDFVPTNGIDWCFGGDLGSGCFTVDLSQFDGLPNVRIKFETYNDYGNNIYIDNVQLSGNCVLSNDPPVAGFNISTNTVCAGSSVQFTDQSTNTPTTYNWSFPGGTPATSNLPSPSITYNTPGTYNVTLNVSNAYGSDQMVMSSAVVVNASPNVQVNNATVSLCSGSSASLTASGAQSYVWSPATGLSGTTGASVNASPSGNITYTVTGTTTGCTDNATVQVTVNPVPATPMVVSGNDVGFVMLNTPAVQGQYAYTLPAAGWGSPDFATISVEADMVIARSAANDSLLCSAAFNAAQVAGKIAVVYRGICEFGDKALNAQNAGAVAVIIVNNVADAPIEMGAGVNGASVSIPVFMVAQAVGTQINGAVRGGNGRAVIGQFNGGALTFCPGETVRLAAPSGHDSYSWTDGGTTAVGIIGTAGQHAVTVFNAFGCGATSTSFTVTQHNVTQPVIIDNGSTLSSTVSGTSYQWFLEGNAISNSNSATIPVQGPGIYTVTVTDANGCVSTSDPYEVIAVNIRDLASERFAVWPNPASDAIDIVLPASMGAVSLEMIAADGRVVMRTTASGNISTLDISSLAAGTYVLRVQGNDTVEVMRVVKQ